MFRRHTRTHHRSSSRLHLEHLEDRTVPATFHVTSLENSFDGSLRLAIEQANGDQDPTSTIIFDSSLAGGTINLETPLPEINHSIDFHSPAGRISIRRNSPLPFRIFHVPDSYAGYSVSMSNLTISNGLTGEFGGGIYVGSSHTMTLNQCRMVDNWSDNDGGGIYSLATSLTLINCVIAGNSAGYLGGGVFQSGGHLSMQNCEVSGNDSSYGGGMGTLWSTQAVLTNCTLSGNAAFVSGSAVSGGAQGAVTLNNCTVTECTTTLPGAAIYSEGFNSAVILNNCIVANIPGRTFESLYGGVIQGSNNLIEDGSGGLAATISGDPLLGPLAYNGGTTRTHELLEGSPAIDAGNNSLVPAEVTSDQRGLARISGGTVDLGAFEVSNQPPTLDLPGQQFGYEDVDLPITGITVGSTENLTVTLDVSFGTLTLGSFTGLIIQNNGTASVTLFGSAVNLNAALATLVYRGQLNFSGNDTLHIHAADTSQSTPGSVLITLQSADQQAEALRNMVLVLHELGVLNQGQTQSLLVKLSLNGTLGDIGKVSSFLHEVEDLLRAGILTQDQAAALNGPGGVLLLSVTRR